ncbi:MAG: hypothetical protein KL787_10455 [Taibaiella sp.]|nr:hypothetical protein [Taibaiella sp.]
MKKLFLALSAAVLFAACGSSDTDHKTGTDGTEAETVEPKEEAQQSDNFLTDAAALQKAEDELKALPKFNGKEVRVFQNVHFYNDGRIMIELQDPDKPENIDHYEYANGKWGEPQPVQISGDGNMKDNTTPLNDIKFAAVATVAKNWNEKAAAIEGVEPLSMVYFFLNVMRGDRYWNANTINGTREKYNITFNMDGSVKEFEKS